MLKRKIAKWDGPNKRSSRFQKLAVIRDLKEEGFIPESPKCLTFAGSQARFEKHLVNRSITPANKITTVQTSTRIGGHNGDPVLRKLLKLKSSEKKLAKMRVWPASFSLLSENSRGTKIKIPVIKSTKPKWYRMTSFRKEMQRFKHERPGPFDVLDIDICGVFSEKTGYDITRLFENGSTADCGVLFVNHQKGRDGRFGKLFDFLRRYYNACPYFDVDGFEDEEGNRINLKEENELSFYFTRYVLVPMFYVIELFKAGYQAHVERLFEYRDRNPASQAGVCMLQWFLLFWRGNDKEKLDEQLEYISQEAYRYIQAID